MIGLVRQLPRVGVGAGEATEAVGLLSRLNPLAFIAALLAPTPMGNSEIRPQRGFLIPENANPDLVAEYLIARQTDPERAQRILAEIWTNAAQGSKRMLFSRIPFGFKNPAEFAAFAHRLNAGLAGVGLRDVRGIFQGSSVTGVSFDTGEPFDVGRISDFDIALAGRSLFDKASALGVDLRSGGTRTGPLQDVELAKLGLLDLSAQLSSIAGRPVRFMIYQSPEAAIARSPSIPVPRP